MSYAKIMPRRGTNYEWTTENPILAEGELGIEVPESGVGTGLCRFKIGDGFKPWNQLAYAFDGASASSITGGNASSYHLILIRQDYHKTWLEVNPVMEDGELIYVIDYQAFKMGDGVSTYEQLGWVGKQYMFDFGDEDAEPVESDNTPTATLADLIEETVENVSGEQLIKGVALTNPVTNRPVMAVGATVENSKGEVVGSTMSVIADDVIEEEQIPEENTENATVEEPTEEVEVKKTTRRRRSKKTTNDELEDSNNEE